MQSDFAVLSFICSCHYQHHIAETLPWGVKSYDVRKMFVPAFVETMWQLYTILSTETNTIIAEVTPICTVLL